MIRSVWPEITRAWDQETLPCGTYRWYSSHNRVGDPLKCVMTRDGKVCQTWSQNQSDKIDVYVNEHNPIYLLFLRGSPRGSVLEVSLLETSSSQMFLLPGAPCKVTHNSRGDIQVWSGSRVFSYTSQFGEPEKIPDCSRAGFSWGSDLASSSLMAVHCDARDHFWQISGRNKLYHYSPDFRLLETFKLKRGVPQTPFRIDYVGEDGEIVVYLRRQYGKERYIYQL